MELIGRYLKVTNNFEINLIFKNNAHIVLTMETIEVRLRIKRDKIMIILSNKDKNFDKLLESLLYKERRN